MSSDMAETVDRLLRHIDGAEKSMQQIRDAEDKLGGLRSEVESILAGSTQAAESLRPSLAEVVGQIEKLGPPPKSDQPPESPAVAAERTRLNQLATTLDGAIRSTELTWLRARQLIERITVIRHALFTKNLFERLPNPLLPVQWRNMREAWPGLANRVGYLTDDWISWAQKKRQPISMLLAGTALLYALLHYLIARIVRRHMINHPEPATFFERAGAVAWTAPARMLPGIAAAIVCYGSFEGLDLIFPPWNFVASGLLKGVLVFVVGSGIIRTVFAPRRGEWRLVPLSDRSAGRIVHLLQFVIAIFAADIALGDINRAFLVPQRIIVMQSFAISIAAALALVGVLLTPFAGQDEPLTAVPRVRPRWMKLPLWGFAIAILAASMAGYIAFGRFIAQQLVLTAIILGVTALLYLAIRAITRDPIADGRGFGSSLERQFGLDDTRRRQLAWLTEITLTFALTLLALPLLMLQWGFAAADIHDWGQKALFGFQVGHFRISLARILIGTALFTALVFVTRLVQRMLRERVLQSSRFDAGIANSIDMSVGYAGIIMSALIAVSYAGFDVTSLAIVAGALSVGIGFGLQSIVNNFVSGLILLIERPIKVGDWIVLGADQGNVRRISVRATEIETFDRASLIIPNSELIGGRVLNWTHRNRMGRTTIKVSVDMGADPEQVMAIMAAAGRSHPRLMDQQPPSVSFDSLGPGTLDFSMRITLDDVTHGRGVQNDVKIAILKALRAAGIVSVPPKAELPAPPAQATAAS